MRAIEITQPGGPEVLRRVSARTRCRPGELLIAVQASGVNRPDVLQRKGLYPMPPGVSDLPGLEIAGTVAAGAAQPTWPRPAGHRRPVCALVAGGGYAELCVAPAGQCLPVPGAERHRGRQPARDLLHRLAERVRDRAPAGRRDAAGAGRVQRHRRHRHPAGQGAGRKVIVTAGSDDKCAACVALGADHAINYRTQDFVAEVKRLTGGRASTWCWTWWPATTSAARSSAWPTTAAWRSSRCRAAPRARSTPALVLRKRLSITGSTLRPRSVAYKTELARALRAQAWPLIEAAASSRSSTRCSRPPGGRHMR
jgi:NADPH2:quinone reductase